MIAALLAIMVTLSQGGDPCALGGPVDWYAWTRTPDAEAADLTVTYHDGDLNFWLYDAPSEVVLFVFQPADQRQGAVWHGRCARTFPR
jgi:hypothetical protein